MSGWSDRQQALLREMGIRLWPTAAGGGVDEPSAGIAVDEAVSEDGVPPPKEVASSTQAAPTLQTRPEAAHETDSPDSPRGARPTGVAAMDWPTLKAAVAGCRACGLCESRRQTVFGTGNEQADWMLVGEAPGEQEDLKGEPFVGKAGQLLDAMLLAVGLTRSEAPPTQQVYIVNVLKCRPPGNRNPEPQEVAQCEPFLVRQVELVAPKLILAMGRFAVQSVLKSQEPIGRLRGRVHRYHGVPVVVTYHPAYLLRNPLDKARSWEDLCLAKAVLAGQA